MTKTTFSVDGMTCGHCLQTVDRALRALPDVSVERIAVGSATVSFDESRTTTDRIASAIEGAGYRVLRTS